MFWSKSVNTFKSTVADKKLFAQVTFRRVDVQVYTEKQSDLKNETKLEPNYSADIIHISFQIIGPAHSMNGTVWMHSGTPRFHVEVKKACMQYDTMVCSIMQTLTCTLPCISF